MVFNNRKSQLCPFTPQSLLDASDDLEDIAKNSNKESIKTSVYKSVREILCELYHDKCAYCESKEFKPDIEHYRPKKGVTGVIHSGYYWLCYEWSNLIPSCPNCNRPPGKSNQFPIIGNRVDGPTFLTSGKLDTNACQADKSPLIDEQPYLLHPEIDDCKQFFKFDNKGKIEGVDSKGRGEQTWKICDLNRDNLLYRRQQLLDNQVEAIERFLKLFLNERLDENGLKDGLKLCFEKLDKHCEPDQEYSLIAIYTKEHFDEIIIPLISFSFYQKIVSNAYKAYLAGTL